ncbi:hypothetical protein NW768_002356 [Fusarium equiseti]|uniref:Uncharacterized protein n=1 Tax=Fusarium equiseti TaxID=61235 RepID=A0ABQ8RN84_FUSEQ|nr:hypothetical protein NW768_002356 [Fusarium equiseti]
MAWLTKYERLLQRARQLVNFHDKFEEDPMNLTYIFAATIPEPDLVVAKYLASGTEPLDEEEEYPASWETVHRSLPTVLRIFRNHILEGLELEDPDQAMKLATASKLHDQARLAQVKAEAESKKGKIQEEAEARNRRLEQRKAQLAAADLKVKTDTASKKRKAEVEIPTSDRVLRPRRK